MRTKNLRDHQFRGGSTEASTHRDTPRQLRKAIFWSHLALGLAVSVAVLPMALTGALMAFQSELTGWFENDVRVASTGVSRLNVSELIRRAASELGSDVKTNSVQLERSPTAPAILGADVRFWLLDPYDGHVLRPSAIRGFFLVAEEVHWSIGLVLLGMRGIGTALAGLVTIGILLLSLTGPWLWWLQKTTSAQLRKRLGFSGTLRSATRSFAWHHIIGIWCMPSHPGDERDGYSPPLPGCSGRSGGASGQHAGRASRARH